MHLHKDVVELVLATPQQSQVISHCLTPQIEAENKGCHLSVTQLPMTGGCQGAASKSSTTSLHKTRVKLICVGFLHRGIHSIPEPLWDCLEPGQPEGLQLEIGHGCGWQSQGSQNQIAS